jgi:DNA-binding transcriptional MerR regulator
MTIEDLAAASGLPFTTIRMYQHKGLLLPPERRGRVGYYGPGHVARLELIAQMQQRGYSLAAIKDLVDTWQEGRSLAQVLGLETAAAGVVSPPDEVRLAPEELAARFADVELDGASMARAQELGLLTIDGGEIVVSDPAFLDVGARLAALGVPISEILDEYEHLQQVADELAARFTSIFERNLWSPVADRGLPPDDLPALADALAELGPMAEQIVVASMRRALVEQAQQFLASRAGDVR